MDRESIKKAACAAIDRERERIIAAGEAILRRP